MTKITDIETAIEGFIDETTAEAVLAVIISICHGKAEHLRSNWQDNKAAQQWERLAHTVDKAYSKASELAL